MIRLHLTLAALLPSVFLLSGCSTSPDYGCKAPDGTTCKSISEVYKKTEGDAKRSSPYATDDDAKRSESFGTDDDARESKDKKPGDQYKPVLAEPKAIALPKIKPGEPIRVEPRILRVWLAPWEDEDEVFYDQSFLYVIVDRGHWKVSQNRGLIESSWRNRPVRAPLNKTEPGPADASRPPSATSPQEPAPANKTATKAFEAADRKVGVNP